MADEPRSHRIRFSSRLVRIAYLAGLVVLVAVAVALAAIGLSQNQAGTTPLAFGHVLVMGAVVIAILGIVAYGPEGFLAALWVFVPLVPALAAIVSVAIYLLSPNDPSQPSALGERTVAVYVGVAATLFAWGLSAFPGAEMACRDRAQLRVFNDLRQRFFVLRARVDSECSKPEHGSTKAVLEAQSLIAAVERELIAAENEGPALRWVLATGYTGIARQLHRVEEALFAVEDASEIVGDALHDDLSLEDSGLRNRFTLRRIIRDVLPSIAPGAAESLLRPVPALPPASAVISRSNPPAAAAGDHQTDTRGASPAEAREALREVQFAINDYRDDIVDSFVRGRNRVIWTYLVVAISTYVLVALGLLVGIPKTALVSVAVLYLVGSIVGLFSRLRIESSRASTNEDYGLYLARLITGPMLSGLAGVAGVYLIAQAPAFLGPLTASAPAAATASPSASPSPADLAAISQVPQPKALADIYDLTVNQLALLVAAVFGLAPGLLTSRLQQQVDRLERDLQRSEPATSTAAGGPAAEGTAENGYE